MKYLCLVYHDEQMAADLPGCMHHGLQWLEPATEVRVWNGTLTIDDVPADAQGEQLSGFVIIEARDLNDAIRVAARLPAAAHSRIELRSFAMMHGG